MLRYVPIRSVLAAFLLTIGAGVAAAQEYKARATGFFELGALNNETGAILSNGTGKLTLDVDQNSATYSLTYSGLSANVTQAHLHFAKVHVPGGIYAFLCTNLGNGPAGTPPCPAAGGTVTGTITSASILAVPTQNITAGDFGALRAALGSNTTYVNIHTVKFPAGEIRGQVQLSNDDEDEGRGHDR
jgi:CHRD domain